MCHRMFAGVLESLLRNVTVGITTSIEDVVDEDDFLYGGGEGDVEASHTRAPALHSQHSDTKPDTQKLISNPAFTALLKSIGLDDLKIAERVKVTVCCVT